MSNNIAANADQPARRQQQRSLVTQQKLLDAAISAFSENGFKGTSTRDIAERAGVHHPLITYHFKNKDQLWRAAADQVFTDFARVLAKALSESGDACPKTRFTSMIRAFVRQTHKQPAIHRFIMQESSYQNTRLDWLIEAHMQPFFDATVGHIRTLQEIGVAPAGNPAMLYHMIRIAAGGMLAVSQLLVGTSKIDLDSEDTREELVQMIVRVFLPGDIPSQ